MLERLAMILATAGLCSCCCSQPRSFGEEEKPSDAKCRDVSRAAYTALIALEPPARAAEAQGDSAAVARISSATLDLLLLLDEESSEAAMRRIVALSHFDLGTAPTEVYGCVVVRKGRAIGPIIEQELRENTNPCTIEFGPESPICRARDETAEMLRFLLSEIGKKEPCTIVP